MKQRILSWLLVVAMVISVLPGVVFAEGNETLWTKVNFGDIQPEDTVAITMSKEGVTYALPTVGAGGEGQPIGETATAAGGVLTTAGDAATFGWNIVPAEGGFHIKSGENYLYITATNNGVRIGETACVWTINEDNYLSAVDSAEAVRYLGVYTKNPDWRCYKAYLTGNISGQTLEFWVLDPDATPSETTAPTEAPTEPSEEPTVPSETPTEPPATEEGMAALVTELEHGAKVYVYNPKNKAVLTSTVSGTQLVAATAELEDEQLPVTDEMEKLTVEIDADGYYSFLNESGEYLTCGTSANNLTFEAAASDQSLWAVEATEGGFFVKSVSNSPLALEYYKGNYTVYNFQAYNPGAYLMQFFSAGTAGGFTDQLAEGDRVIIYNPSHSMALSNAVIDAEKNQDLVGTELTLTGDDQLTGYTDEHVWTVSVNDDGSYGFTSKDGQKLAVSNRTHLGFGDEYNAWTLQLIEGKTDEFFVSGGNGVYLEWYASKGYWSAFYNPSEELYAIRFYIVGDVVQPANKVATPKASVKSGVVDSGTVVELTCATEGATILYKIGEGEWQTYAETLTITEDTVLTVKAVLEGKEDSKEVTFTYTIYVPPVLGENQAQLVTDASELVSGDQIIIVTKDFDYALGVTQKANNRDYGNVIKAYDRCSYDEGVQIITLEAGVVENTFALYATNGDFPGYLYASSENGNLLRTQDFKDMNASFSVTIAANGEATITAQIDKKSNTIRYNTQGIFSCYGATGQRPVCIYKLDGQEKPTAPEDGDLVVIYNNAAKGVLSRAIWASDGVDFDGIWKSDAKIANGEANCANGAFLFHVEKDGEYYNFRNDSYAKLSTTMDSDLQLIYIGMPTDPTLARNSDWQLEEYNGGYRLSQGTEDGKIYLCYNKDGYFTVTTADAVTDIDTVTFRFYPCSSDKITDGIVNDPQADFGTPAPAYAGSNYILRFTVDAVFGVKEIGAYLGETKLACTQSGNGYSVMIPSEYIVGSSLTVTVKGLDNKDVAINSEVVIEVVDEPVISDVTPIANAQTKEDKRPVISAKLTNIGENPTLSMTLNGEEVAALYADGIYSYTPAEDLADGRVTAKITVTRADGKTATKSWNFTVGENNFILMYGQLHSHTGEYSDGNGTLASALEYIKNLPDEANVDFVAFTDHSNYFDSSDKPNPEGALFDKDLCTPESWKLWNTYKTDMAEFNAANDDIIAIPGFEMTWSGGPGHMNTFVTEGIVSRNNKTLNNKSSDAGMRAYYDLLSTDAGVDSITQLNHPGTMFGNFSNFAYWNPLADTRVHLVEVGNGEGPIHGSGYYPSYEQYILALDKGWHIAPTNNQDNHKSRWGNGNEARDVVLAEEFSEEAIYEAIRNYRIYATEDRNLAIDFTCNELPMGTIIESVPSELKFEIALTDPDATDSIEKVELVVNSGKVAYTCTDAAQLASGKIAVTLEPEYSYYFLRVTQKDKDIAVTAPIWVGESMKVGLKEVTASETAPKVGEEVTISTAIYNDEGTDAVVKNVIYTLGGSEVLFTDTTPYVIAAGTSQTIEWKYVPTEAKLTNITVTVIMDFDGKEYTFTSSVELNVMNAEELTRTDIAEVRKQTEEGYYFLIEGTVTSNASGYDKNTAFFDCIYVQDETGGINCFPVAGDYRIGDRLRLMGTTDFYQGEIELQVSSVEKIGTAEPVVPTEITPAQLNDRSAEGMLVQIRGIVTEIVKANGVVESIYIRDENNDIARIFIDGYITSDKTIENLEVGAAVVAEGIASYDDTYAVSHGSYARIRIRDRADIVASIHTHVPEILPFVAPTCTEPGLTAGAVCVFCGEILVAQEVYEPLGHNFEDEMCTRCGEVTEDWKLPFHDVAEDAWYKEAVEYVYRNRIMTGVDEHEFAPEATLTRAMVVTMLYRMAGEPAVGNAENPFDDVIEDFWYTDAIIWGYANEIVKGMSETEFAPDASVTREQLVTFLYRYADFVGYEAKTDENALKSFADANEVSEYALDAMAWAVTEGIVNGVDENSLQPTGTATRAQAAKVFMMLDKLLAEANNEN